MILNILFVINLIKLILLINLYKFKKNTTTTMDSCKNQLLN